MIHRLNASRDRFWNMTPDKTKALQHMKHLIPLLVYDAVNLEGIEMSLFEVNEILKGYKIKSHYLSDQNMTANQAKTWEFIFDKVKADDFPINKKTLLQIHAIAGHEEALEWGCFRHGFVTISGSEYSPPDPNALDLHWDELLKFINQFDDVYDQAIALFLQMVRAQFFWDVNKRTGRFMMNGLLLSYGYPIINVPVKRKQEFNSLMLAFYDSSDMQPMNQFLRSCIHEKIRLNFKCSL